MEYPKWVQRSQHIGPVLVQSKKDEDALMADWESEQISKAPEEESETLPEITLRPAKVKGR